MDFEVDFEPIGRRYRSSPGDTILSAAQRAGVMLSAVCGGEGVCGRCVVRVIDGSVSPPNSSEEAELGCEQTAAGWRLACQAEILGDLRVHIPPSSLVTAQRTQTEGQSLEVALDPAVQVYQVNLTPPSLQDLRSDATRLLQGLAGRTQTIPTIAAPLLRRLSNDLRRHDFQVQVFLRGDEIIAVRPTGTAPLGLAVDIGTTKLAAYLVDLTSGKTLALAGAMNPQIAYGEDVMARIGHAISHEDGGEQLRIAIVNAINELARDLCARAGKDVLDIADAVIVGNTAMHHLFLGFPVKQLGLAPYVPAESAALDIPSSQVGLILAPGAYVHLLPNIAGFVGADHVAMLLASDLPGRGEVVLGLDIGTNTEVSLFARGRHFACSTASGPAFEGAHIRYGMRAAPGAIEKVLIHDGEVLIQTVDNGAPVGLCGSGIIDLVAQLLHAGIINGRGAVNLASRHPRLRQGAIGVEFVVAEAAGDGGEAITFTRADVNEIQLAKGAIRAGVNILSKKAGIAEEDIELVVIAGAFGSYLDVQSGIDIGMFPKIDKKRFIQVGNAAGAGARMALLSRSQRKRAVEIAQQIQYVELTIEKDFSSTFARALLLG